MEFRSNIEDSDIADSVAETIVAEVTSDDSPYEFSDTLVENVIEDDEP